MEHSYVGISRFCQYWSNMPMLQQTFDSLKDELSSENDGTIDAAKAIVECACQVIIKALDDPNNPIKEQSGSPFKEKNPSINNWIVAATNLLNLGNIKGDPFSKTVSQYFNIVNELGHLRNKAGPLSHGRDGLVKKLSTYQRKASVLAADAVVSFLHEAYLEHELSHLNLIEPFDSLTFSNSIIDKHCTFTAAEVDDDGNLSVKISYLNEDDIDLNVDLSVLLFHVDRIAYKNAFYSCKDIPNKDETV